MANFDKRRRLAIDTAIRDLNVLTGPAIIERAKLDLITSGVAEPKALAGSVYSVLKHYETIGRLVKVPNTCPAEYTINNFIEDRPEQKYLLKDLSGEEMIELFRNWVRNYEARPEAVKKYQDKMAELTEENKKLKVDHEQALAHAKAEYKKVADKLNSFLALAKS
jgi:hypothetical protein